MSDLPDDLTDQLIKVLIRRAYLDRRATLKNDEDPTAGDAPSNTLTATFYKGKFFPRGCRGLIESLSVYCKRTASGTLELSLAPFPGMGPIVTVTITPGAAWAWASVNHREMWNYDSLFIWVSDIGADVSYGYDEAGTPDGYDSDATQKVWTAETRRYAFRVVGKGFTPGDIPVSGTLNVIVIPGASTGADSESFIIPAGICFYDTEIKGAGNLIFAVFSVVSAARKNNLQPRILIDGGDGIPLQTIQNWGAFFVDQYNPGISRGIWDTTNNYYSLVVALNLPFQRSLKLGFKNIDAVNPHSGRVIYVYTKKT